VQGLKRQVKNLYILSESVEHYRLCAYKKLKIILVKTKQQKIPGDIKIYG